MPASASCARKARRSSEAPGSSLSCRAFRHYGLITPRCAVAGGFCLPLTAALVLQGRDIMASKASIQRRAQRVRRQIKTDANGRPRLSVHRSSKHIYAQVIDDSNGTTLAAASTLQKDLKGSLKTGADSAAAAVVGKLLAERAKNAGVTQVVFDRGAYLFHGRVKALADAAREGGLEFQVTRSRVADVSREFASTRASGKEQGKGQWHNKDVGKNVARAKSA